MRVFFLIRSLERGGAERQLLELVRGLSSVGVTVAVCTFYDGGALRGELASIPDVRVLSLGKRGRWDVGPVLVRLSQAVHEFKPDVVHGYMAFANELSLVMARTFGIASVWGLRSSEVDPSQRDDFSRRQFAVGARLSRFADAIIVNSEAGRTHHVRFGYSGKRMVVVPNGIDCTRFRSDPDARARLRKEWGVSPEQRLMGVVARIDPVKDHKTFVRAAAAVAKQHALARFVCVGHGSQAELSELKALAAALELGDRLIWAGPRDDMSAVYNALDILVLSSISEGFPNVVAEAMATQKVCVVTNVGDAANIVGELGVVVPRRDSAALADGIHRLLNTSESQLSEMGERGRARIVNDFSIASLVRTTEKILERAAQHAFHAPSL